MHGQQSCDKLEKYFKHAISAGRSAPFYFAALLQAG